MKPPLDLFHCKDFSHFEWKERFVNAILTTCGEIYIKHFNIAAFSLMLHIEQ